MKFRIVENFNSDKINLAKELLQTVYDEQEIKDILDTNNITYSDLWEAAADNLNLFDIDEEQIKQFSDDVYNTHYADAGEIVSKDYYARGFFDDYDKWLEWVEYDKDPEFTPKFEYFELEDCDTFEDFQNDLKNYDIKMEFEPDYYNPTVTLTGPENNIEEFVKLWDHIFVACEIE